MGSLVIVPEEIFSELSCHGFCVIVDFIISENKLFLYGSVKPFYVAINLWHLRIDELMLDMLFV